MLGTIRRQRLMEWKTKAALFTVKGLQDVWNVLVLEYCCCYCVDESSRALTQRQPRQQRQLRLVLRCFVTELHKEQLAGCAPLSVQWEALLISVGHAALGKNGADHFDGCRVNSLVTLPIAH